LNLKKPLAIGRTAEVYPWKENKIIKLFFERLPLDFVQFEHKVSKLVESADLHVPKVFEIIEVKGRYGIVFEFVKGETMLQALLSNPFKLKSYAHQLAEQHISIHKIETSELPSQRQFLVKRIRSLDIITAKEKEEILKILDDLPDDNRLCHDDFHPDNIILTTKGPIIIDWPNSSRGNPLADVMMTSLILKLGSPPAGLKTRIIVRIMQSRFQKAYLKNYFQLSSYNRQQLKLWELPIAAARLADEIPEEEVQLLKIIRSNLMNRC
jgi:uncharacterized protein (TIGR02172 family)